MSASRGSGRETLVSTLAIGVASLLAVLAALTIRYALDRRRSLALADALRREGLLVERVRAFPATKAWGLFEGRRFEIDEAGRHEWIASLRVAKDGFVLHVIPRGAWPFPPTGLSRASFADPALDERFEAWTSDAARAGALLRALPAVPESLDLQGGWLRTKTTSDSDGDLARALRSLARIADKL